MEIDHFLILLALNWPWYVLFLVLSTLSLFPFARRFTLSWYDPLRYAVVFAMLANVIPPFLWVTQQMATEMLIYFILSETAFWLGIATFVRKRAPLSDIGIHNEEHFVFYFFIVCFTLYVTFTLLSYVMFGIPLFMDKSRLSVFSGSGGFGILQRFNNFFSYFVIFYIFHMLHKKTHKTFCYLSIVLVTMFLIFSGSKSKFLMLLFAYFGYKLFYLSKTPHTSKRIIIYLGVGVLLALFVISFQVSRQGGEAFDSVVALITRFVASGDCYFYAYPNDVYQSVELGNKFQYLFSGLLTSMRLVSYEDISPSIGVQLTEITRPYLAGENTGPNSRMPILSYLLFGWGGIIFAYIAGWVTSFCMFRLPRFLPHGIIFGAYMTYLYATFAGNVTDFTMGVSNLFDILLNLGFIVVVAYVFTSMTSASNHKMLGA